MVMYIVSVLSIIINIIIVTILLHNLYKNDID